MHLSFVIHQLMWNVLMLQFPKFIDLLNPTRPYTPFGRTIADELGLGPSHSPRGWLIFHAAWAQFGVFMLFILTVLNSTTLLTEKEKKFHSGQVMKFFRLSFWMLVQMILMNAGTLGNQSVTSALILNLTPLTLAAVAYYYQKWSTYALIIGCVALGESLGCIYYQVAYWYLQLAVMTLVTIAHTKYYQQVVDVYTRILFGRYEGLPFECVYVLYLCVLGWNYLV